ncbi:hypothetical protein [Shewanella chilikensis]|uniref:hypothetical protein n=1 Tax=Shewanella chilikensis TaxID=558541 RepID=UPI003A986957
MSYQVNFCETKEQLKHLAEVVTGKADGSPTGADINTSTLAYAGLVRDTLPELLSKLGWYSVGDWSSDPLISNVNEYVLYNGIRYVPLSIPYQVNSTANPDPETLVGTELKIITDVTDEDVKDAQNEIVGGLIYHGDDGNSLKTGDTIPSSTTHVVVKILGINHVVEISPRASGSVTSLTSDGATVGGVSVSFIKQNVTAINKASALLTSYSTGTIIQISSCNNARFKSVISSDTGGLYLGSMPNGNKLRHIPREGFLLKTVRTSDFEIESGSDVSQFLIDAASSGYGQVFADDDFQVNQLADITGIKYFESQNGAELTINDAVGRVKSDTDDLEIKGITFNKSGSYSDTTFEAYLLETNGENTIAERCRFMGQWAGYKLQGNNSTVNLCYFSDGTFMLRVGEGVVSCKINDNFFTRGTRRYTEGEQQGDGIKITAQSSTQGYNENIIISNNIFYDVYRDCVDGYVGANRVIISGNMMINWGAHSLDLKSRLDDNAESPDGGPLARNVLIEGNMIWKDVVRPDFDLTLAAVVMSVISGTLPLPTTEADVRDKGLRGMEFRNNRLAYIGNGALISATSTWRTVIEGNTLTDLGQIGQVIYAPNCWHLRFVSNTVNIDPSNVNNVDFSLSMNQAEINDNTFNRLLIATDGMTNIDLRRNKFNGEGAISRGLNLSSEGVSAVDNKFDNFTSFGAQIFGSAQKCRFDYNEIRNCPAPLGISTPSGNTYNTVRGNVSMDSGAFTGLNRITDNGGIANGNDHVDYSV